MKKFSLLITLAMAALLLFGSAIAGTQQENHRDQRGEEWQEGTEERAENVKKRIDLIISRFDNNKERHVAAYNKVKDELKKQADDLTAKGYDLTKVREDYQTLDSMIVEFARDYAAFVDKLRAAENLTPGEAEFRAAIEDARKQLKVVRQDVLDIRHFYQTVVRPDVKDLKNQAPNTS